MRARTSRREARTSRLPTGSRMFSREEDARRRSILFVRRLAAKIAHRRRRRIFECGDRTSLGSSRTEPGYSRIGMVDNADDRRLVPQVHRRPVLLHGLQHDRQGVVEQLLLASRVLGHRGNGTRSRVAGIARHVRNFRRRRRRGLGSRDGSRDGSRERSRAQTERVRINILLCRALWYYYKIPSTLHSI